MPIFSICIPTYNRSGCLYFTLKSIVEQDIFINTDDIEIIISDNCSSDLTYEISKIFLNKFPNKIKYHRNETNIGDLNFEKVLTLASGEVLKLHNDNFIFKEGSLDLIINTITELKSDKPMIFFSNGNSPAGKDILCNDLDELVESASYLTTWIAAFSMWKEDFDNFKDFTKSFEVNLIQTDVLFRMSAAGKKIFIYNEEIFDGRDVLKKGGYNQAKVFGQNYLGLLKPYLDMGLLNKQTYEKEKKLLLLNHIIPMRFSISGVKDLWSFKKDGYWKYLIKDYWYNFYFYTSVIKIFRLTLDAKLNLISRKLNKNSYKKYWRKRNRHNQVTIEKNIDDKKIFVGVNSKGNIDAEFGDNPNELLIIGDNVKIGDNVRFVYADTDLIIIQDGTEIPSDSIVNSSLFPSQKTKSLV